VAELAVRLGIFGGTFDPPHLGHLILASEAAEQLHLDTVLWVITPDPPHKQFQAVSPLPVRLALLEAALSDEPLFEISRVDLDRPGPQYAVDTLQLLAELYPGSELYYLIGGDSLHDLPGWYAPERLIALTTGLGVMRRPGDRIDMERLERLLPGIAAKLCFIDAPLLEISSRDLRERIRSGRHARHFLSEAVWNLIQKNKTYTKASSNP
jgi:nicotinate-nucleotide adenylyltransferase